MNYKTSTGQSVTLTQHDFVGQGGQETSHIQQSGQQKKTPGPRRTAANDSLKAQIVVNVMPVFSTSGGKNK